MKNVRNLKIVNMKKFIRSTTILALIILSIILFLGKSSLSHSDKEQINYEKIFVVNGDTLWNIALDQQQNNPYYINKDVRFIISELRKINSLENGNLQIGQELKVPVM